MSKCFYVTTAIDYVNGQPHLGHAYEKVMADVVARARRSLGEPVFFLTGLDEHGQKVQQAAQAEGKSPQEYCDALAVAWQDFARKLGLSNDDFVRTTQPRHKAVVQAILARLHADGQLLQKNLQGLLFHHRRIIFDGKGPPGGRLLRSGLWQGDRTGGGELLFQARRTPVLAD